MCFLQSGQHLLLVRSGMDLRLYRWNPWKAFCPFRRHRKTLENSLDSQLTRKMHVFIASVWSQLSENWRCSCQAPWSGAKIDSSNVALNGMGESRREDGIPKETIEPLDTFQSWLRLVQFVSRPCYVLIDFWCLQSASGQVLQVIALPAVYGGMAYSSSLVSSKMSMTGSWNCQNVKRWTCLDKWMDILQCCSLSGMTRLYQFHVRTPEMFELRGADLITLSFVDDI